MNIKDLSGKPTTVDEVAMNPTAYAQSVEKAETAGVLVGFEFEVCVPNKTMVAQAEAAARAANAAPTEPMTAERVERLIRQRGNMWNGERDEPYTKWDQYFTPKNISAYPSTMAAKTAITTQRLADAQAVLAEFPQDRLANWQRLAKAKIARRIREGYYGRSAAEFTPEQRAVEVIKDIADRYAKDLYEHPGWRSRPGTPEYDAWQQLQAPVRKIQAGTNIEPDDVFKAMFADLNPDQGAAPIFANINQFFTYDPQAVYDAYGLMLRDPDVPEDVRDIGITQH